MCFWRDLVVLIWKITKAYSAVVAYAWKLVPRHNTSLPRNRIECGSIRLVPERPRAFLFDASFISFILAPTGSQTTSMVRRKNC